MGLLDTPISLCEALNVQADDDQLRLMAEVAMRTPVVERELDSEGCMMRAAAMSALWRVLSKPASICTVIASDEALAREFMQFLYHVTRIHSVALRDQTEMPRWNQLRVQGRRDWQIRVLPLNVYLVTQSTLRTEIGVILGARGADPTFVEALEGMEKSLKGENQQLIRLW